MSIEEPQEVYVGKREFKQEMAEIQSLALKLVELSPSDFNQITLDDDLRSEIETTRKMKSHSARRRQLRFLTQVINRANPVEIRKALAVITDGNRAANSQFRAIERLRDKIAAGKQDAIELVLEKFPHADRQHLRNLQRNIKKETSEEGIARAGRVLYHYLRDLGSVSKQASL